MNRDSFTTVLSKTIFISNCGYEKDYREATEWTLKVIESNDFQSGDMKLILNVEAPFRDYEVMMYRDGGAVHVWLDGNFAYEIDLSLGAFKGIIGQLFHNWRGVPGIEMIYHGDRCDPELQRDGLHANYREVEDYLYEDFIDGLRESNKYDSYVKMKRSTQEKKFNEWLFNHYSRIVDIFLQLNA